MLGTFPKIQEIAVAGDCGCKAPSMLQLDNARYYLVSSLPGSSWRSDSQIAFENQTWGLISDLQDIRDSLWL